MSRFADVLHAPLYEPVRYPDVKDPSPVFDGTRWHLFGTGCGLASGLEILHATARKLTGPWHEEPPVVLIDIDRITSPAAPGVCFDGERFHMFLQHTFNALHGDIEHLVSVDGGRSFVAHDTALRSLPGTDEAGIYDADPALVGGIRYLTYAGMSVVGEPELFLARCTSGSWDGPWERVGRILGHADVDTHNQIGDADYEWGLEGPHLLELPDGRCLLTAVCFLAAKPRGQRQRVLLGVAEEAEGPYDVIGPVILPAGPRETGENGHGTAVIENGAVHVVYQERSGARRPWRFRRAAIHPQLLVPPAEDARDAVA